MTLSREQVSRALIGLHVELYGKEGAQKTLALIDATDIALRAQLARAENELCTAKDQIPLWMEGDSLSVALIKMKDQLAQMTAENNVLKLSQSLAGSIADITKDIYIEERSHMLHGDDEAEWFAKATKESIHEELCCALLNWSFCQDQVKSLQQQLAKAQARIKELTT